MTEMYGVNPSKIKLSPNGVNPNQWKKTKENTSSTIKAIFIGSDYFPNIEDVDFIINQIADKCPNIEFIIAGNCCKPFSKIKKENVLLLGKVTHQQKLNIFSNVDIALSPIFSGTGINLKTLEFISAGLPLFSTAFGVRGIY
ncbi:glycosyltransferase [Bacillus thuringiensis]|uniref:glycosyltransferase n=1 Tax=Bacillus thuringiensis TaxID=1428 RepID=UPI0039773B7E